MRIFQGSAGKDSQAERQLRDGARKYYTPSVWQMAFTKVHCSTGTVNLLQVPHIRSIQVPVSIKLNHPYPCLLEHVSRHLVGITFTVIYGMNSGIDKHLGADDTRKIGAIKL